MAKRIDQRVPANTESVAEHLGAWADLIIEWLTALALEHGELHNSSLPPNPYVGIIDVRPYRWPVLTVAGQRLQSLLRKEYSRFVALLTVVLRDQSPSLTEDFEHYVGVVRDVIDREASSESTAGAVLTAAKRAVQALVESLDGLHSDHEQLILVPDTNALYWNPALEKWRHSGGVPFLIALTPTVLRELDGHKADRRFPERQKKADKLVL